MSTIHSGPTAAPEGGAPRAPRRARWFTRRLVQLPATGLLGLFIGLSIAGGGHQGVPAVASSPAAHSAPAASAPAKAAKPATPPATPSSSSPAAQAPAPSSPPAAPASTVLFDHWGSGGGGTTWDSQPFAVSGTTLKVTYSYSGNVDSILGRPDNFALTVADSGYDSHLIANTVASSGGDTTTVYLDGSGTGSYHVEVQASGSWHVKVEQVG
jgi:hypothetical protein